MKLKNVTPKHVLQALLESEFFKEEDENLNDRDARILVAASLQILREVAKQFDIPRFDFDSDIDKAFLLRAVRRTLPILRMSQEELECIEQLNLIAVLRNKEQE